MLTHLYSITYVDFLATTDEIQIIIIITVHYLRMDFANGLLVK